jgi:cytochrome d ubiquinol oxidase subunit II
MAEICLGLIVLGLTAYAVLGGADFGAGFWDLTAGGAARGGRVRGLIQRSMSPVWEANHVWLIFVLVITWTAFPVAFGAIFETLMVPLFLAALGIILRGTAFALRGQAATIAEARFLGAGFAISSVLLPFFLGAALGGVVSGRVDVDNPVASVDAWLNPTSMAIGVLAVLTGAYLAAVYLAGDAQRAGLPDLVGAFRVRALAAGAVTGAGAFGALLVLRSDARFLFDGLTSGSALVAVAVSALAGLATFALVWTGRFEPARFTAAAAVGATIVGWWLAARPDLLPGELTIDAAAAPDATLTALVVSVAVGMLILVPSLAYLYRLVLKGTLDQAYEPLDQRFRPLSAGDEEPQR